MRRPGLLAVLALAALTVAPRHGLAQDEDLGVTRPPGPPPAGAVGTIPPPRIPAPGPAAVAPAGAADVLTNTAIGNLATRNLFLDLSVPESPAFDVLGFTPEKVVRPTSPRDLAANLLNGVDDQGNLQTGVALDFTPYLLWAGENLTIREYNKDRLARLAARTQVSIGTTKGSTSDDKSVRIGTGIKTALWDAGDPRMDKAFGDCLMRAHELVHTSLKNLLLKDANSMQDALALCAAFRVDCQGGAHLEALTDDLIKMQQQLAPKSDASPVDTAPISAASVREAIRAQVSAKLVPVGLDQKWTQRIVDFLDPEGNLFRAQKITKECFDDSKRRNWNNASWDVGGALSWISADGDVDNLVPGGGAVWTSLALNLPDDTWWGLADAPPLPAGREEYFSDFVRDHFQLVLHARYRPEAKMPDEATGGTSTMKEDITLAGGRLRIGTPRAALSVEGAYTYTKPQGLSGDGSGFYSIGGEIKIAENLWLQLSAGTESGSSTGDDQATIFGSIKYGFGSSTPFETWEALEATP